MSETPIPAEITKLGFEDALAEMEGIVRQLEDGSGKLDDGIKAYERGSFLRRHCEAKLKEAQLRVDKVVQNADGSLDSEPADIQ